jgi:hypothetical protein
MAKGRNRQLIVSGLLLTSLPSLASAQDQTTSVESSSTQPALSPTDIPLELWGIANSLLSSYYPSTTVSNVASLTWPSVVVIESSTYTVHSATKSSATSPTTSPSISSSASPISSPTTLATIPVTSNDVSRPLSTDTSTATGAEPSDEANESSGHPKDRTLGIALGIVFGVIAVAVMILALCCVDRRQKRHGGNGIFPSRRRRATSPTDSEVGAWRARHPHMGMVTTIAGPMAQAHNRPPREWVDRYNRLADQQTPPAHMHPAFMHQHIDSTGTATESNPFFTPEARSTENAGLPSAQPEYHPGYPQVPIKSGFNVDVVPYAPYRPEARRSQSSHRRSSSSDRSMVERVSRPPTPFSPMMMLQASSPPKHTNPFVSEYDEDAAQRQRLTQQEPEAYEGDDVVSPMQPPSRSPARRHSPMVHYPSWTEVSEFNFSGESDLSDGNMRAHRSTSSGRDDYGRDRDSVVGRTELA